MFTIIRTRAIGGVAWGHLSHIIIEMSQVSTFTVFKSCPQSCLFITDFSRVIFPPQIPLSMNVSTFLAYDQPTISYCGVHHELLSHKSFETTAQDDTMETHLETELDLSTITAAGRISDHKQHLA